MAAAGSAKAQAALKKQTEQQAAEYARVVSPLVCAAHRGLQGCFVHVLILSSCPGRRTGAVRQLASKGPAARLCHPSSPFPPRNRSDPAECTVPRQRPQSKSCKRRTKCCRPSARISPWFSGMCQRRATEKNSQFCRGAMHPSCASSLVAGRYSLQFAAEAN